MPTITDPDMKHYVGLLAEDMQKTQAELAQAYPQAVRKLTERIERAKAGAAELRKQADELLARADALEAEEAKEAKKAAAQTVVPPVADAPVRRAAPTARPIPPAPAPVPLGNDGSVWKDDLSKWEAATHGVEVSRAPAAPPGVPPAWDPSESVRELGDSQVGDEPKQGDR